MSARKMKLGNIESKIVMMDVDDWIMVPDNPRQRNTEAHANKAKRNHLKELSITHLDVEMAELKNGKQRWKVDGHTRAWLWKHELLEHPNIKLRVKVFLIDTKDDAIELYAHTDNPMAVETAQDQFWGACNLAGLKLQKNFWKTGGGTSAIKVLYAGRPSNLRTIDIIPAVPPFKEALTIIDGYQLDKKKFPAAILAAMICTIVRDGVPAMSFWLAYNNDEGVKTKREMCPIFCLTQYVLMIRDKGKVGQLKRNFAWSSMQNAYRLIPEILSIYEKWDPTKVRSRIPHHSVAKTISASKEGFHTVVGKYLKPLIKDLVWEQTDKEQQKDLTF